MTEQKHQIISSRVAMPSLTVVLINWNTGDRLSQCLKSIETTYQSDFSLERVVIVDNASTDDSMSSIRSATLPLKVILNTENRGFGVACNQGAELSSSEYILFLNPDTILNHNSLSEPIHFLCQPENSQVGICGIQLRDESGAISRSCARFPTLGNMVSTSIGLNRIVPHIESSFHMLDWDHHSSRRVDHVMGAFFLVRKSLFNALHGFDQRFFVYFEDVDFSLRAAEAGWESQYLTGAFAFHEGGGSSNQIKANRLFYSSKSRIQFAWKHFGPAKAIAYTTVAAILEPIVRLALALLERDAQSAMNVAIATRRLWASFWAPVRVGIRGSSAAND